MPKLDNRLINVLALPYPKLYLLYTFSRKNEELICPTKPNSYKSDKVYKFSSFSKENTLAFSNALTISSIGVSATPNFLPLLALSLETNALYAFGIS